MAVERPWCVGSGGGYLLIRDSKRLDVSSPEGCYGICPECGGQVYIRNDGRVLRHRITLYPAILPKRHPYPTILSDGHSRSTFKTIPVPCGLSYEILTRTVDSWFNSGAGDTPLALVGEWPND